MPWHNVQVTVEIMVEAKDEAEARDIAYNRCVTNTLQSLWSQLIKIEYIAKQPD